MSHVYRMLPSVDQVLQSEQGKILLEQWGRSATVHAIRFCLDQCRSQAGIKDIEQLVAVAHPSENVELLQSGKKTLLVHVAAAATAHLQQQSQPILRRVFNGTGVVIHTNLGRSLLPESAIQAVAESLRYPVNLEYDIEQGARGDRDTAIEQLLCALTGAEAATVVNNNAAAVLLMLAAIAPNKEVIVSRGQLVEIGGAFRIPDVMRQAGAQLVEVGTTNRTHVKDYATAINAQTAACMQVHCSNYRIEGFTASVDLADMARLAQQHSLPCLVDAGSGSLVHTPYLDALQEPTIRELMEQGANLVSFSGDKLLGGVQAGFIVGDKALIQRCKQHPLKRALRVDKMTLAALEQVLRLYQHPERMVTELPTHYFCQRSMDDVFVQAERMAQQLTLPEGVTLQVMPMRCQIGSGALPTETLASAGWKITLQSDISLSTAERLLRQTPIPIIARVHQQAIWFDFRCIPENTEAELLQQWQYWSNTLRADLMVH